MPAFTRQHSRALEKYNTNDDDEYVLFTTNMSFPEKKIKVRNKRAKCIWEWALEKYNTNDDDEYVLFTTNMSFPEKKIKVRNKRAKCIWEWVRFCRF